MRHIMRGALGAAVVYPLLWHYLAPEVAAPPLATSAVASEPRRGEPAPLERLAPATGSQAGADELPPTVATRTHVDRLPAPATNEPVAPLEPRALEPAAARAPAVPLQPSVPQPSSPRDPLAELADVPELKETLARVGDIQQHAANPAELERALQGVDDDPAKLARLKALADKLVQLPPPRGDAYLPSSGSAATGTAPR